MASIYEISATFMALQEQLDRLTLDADGEYKTDMTEVYEMYMQSAMDLTDKIDNTVSYIKDLQAEADAIRTEIESLQKRRMAKLNKVAWLEDCVDYALNSMQTDKWENQRHRLTYRTSHSVYIPDEDAFRANESNAKLYLRPQEARIDKEAIKKAIKRGEYVFGAEIRDNKSLQIK